MEVDLSSMLPSGLKLQRSESTGDLLLCDIMPDLQRADLAQWLNTVLHHPSLQPALPTPPQMCGTKRTMPTQTLRRPQDDADPKRQRSL